MINHLTGFLNKCVLAFKRDKPLALVFSVSRMTSFSVIIPYRNKDVINNQYMLYMNIPTFSYKSKKVLCYQLKVITHLLYNFKF